MSRGDVVVFYRTSDKRGPAHYRSVVTSICVVEEVKSKKDFTTVDTFLEYTTPRSVFTEEELRGLYNDSKRLFVAKMTYNAALVRRTTRGQLIDDGIVPVQPRWDFRSLSSTQLTSIIRMGELNERLIVD
jgi:hypothetical protein